MSSRRLSHAAARQADDPSFLLALAYVPRPVAALKRGLDVVAALIGLVVTAPLWPILALLIKWDSPGPVIYRQLRVGRACATRTELFNILKFRTMRADAEARSGAVWASARDPRITRVGALLRKTRLDEIPQLINVLRGDMSLIGPRPERPGFYARLENAAPFYADRTVGLRPGITGLAQVSQGYDSSMEDVARKLGYDAAYAMRLSALRSWLSTDLTIVWRTVLVMALGHGR